MLGSKAIHCTTWKAREKESSCCRSILVSCGRPGQLRIVSIRESGMTTDPRVGIEVVGWTVGVTVGFLVGERVVGEFVVGEIVGDFVVGESVGELVVGENVGEVVVALGVGIFVGFTVGDAVVGLAVGLFDMDGFMVGSEERVGASVVGDSVGDEVVGLSVTTVG